MASDGVDLARSEVCKESLDASRARRGIQATARRRRLRIRGSAGSLIAVALLTAVVGAGLAVGHDTDRSSPRTSAKVLTVGSRGASVAALQRALGIADDGIYGRQTRAAVRRYQRRNDLQVDGIAGPQTLGSLGLSGRSERRDDSSGDEDGDSGSDSEEGVDATLERIAQCESGGNSRAVSPGGRYRGKYQFSRESWRSVGGRGDPADASEEEQDRRAKILFERRGTAPWGRCA